tara:strand:- start:1762 stop:2361 length:600 start_codon:yes stop_codon:yes gene_type:complete
MINTKVKKLLLTRNKHLNLGFGLVDAIISIALLTGVITYGIYFSSLRLKTVFDSNLTTSINKEIERDIERLKSDFWAMFYEENQSCQGGYCLSNGEPLSIAICSDFSQEILNLDNWNIENKSTNKMIQSWEPGPKRSKVFTGKPIKITRELLVESPLREPLLNKTIASISYKVKMFEENIHWLSISLSPEANSWCKELS